jgi:hypothetical protein
MPVHVDTLSLTAENLSFSFETLKERFYNPVRARAGLARHFWLVFEARSEISDLHFLQE